MVGCSNKPVGRWRGSISCNACKPHAEHTSVSRNGSQTQRLGQTQPRVTRAPLTGAGPASPRAPARPAARRPTGAHGLDRHRGWGGIRCIEEGQSRRFEMIRKVEIERCSLTTSKPFDAIVVALNAAIGHLDMAECWRSTHRTHSVTELESTIQKALNKEGLIFFVAFDHGAIMRQGTG